MESTKLRMHITLRFRIIVPVRLFILWQEWAKNGQNIAILCTKSQKFQSCMLLLGTVQLFGTAEYLSIYDFTLIFKFSQFQFRNSNSFCNWFHEKTFLINLLLLFSKTKYFDFLNAYLGGLEEFFWTICKH